MTTEINVYSLEHLERRMRLNQESGWGLEKGTSAQLQLLALFCQKHHLLPGDDVTLYEGKPWITVDGRVKLLRRNHKDEYRGFSQRPLTIEEKEAWGWSSKDIVVKTTIRTVSYGEIEGYGRVSAAEAQGLQVQGVRHNPVARHQPVEMAMKRSLARAERFAFGTESLQDDEEVEEAARTVIEERRDPERVKAGAAKYDEIYPPDDDEPPRKTVTTVSGAVVDAATGEVLERMIDSVNHPLYQRYAALVELAAAREIDYEPATLPMKASELTRIGLELKARLEAA